MGQRLDMYDDLPSGMREYLSVYGWHFSEKMAQWAVSRMTVKDDSGTGRHKPLDPMKKEEIDELLKKQGIRLERDAGHDCVYVANMCKADYLKSSVSDHAHLAMFVKDYIDDPDGYDGLPFTRFYADCIGSGTPIDWAAML